MKLYDVIRKEALDRGDKRLANQPVVEDRPIHHETPRSPHHRLRTIIIGGGAVLFLALLYVFGMKLVYARIVVTERRIPFTLNGLELELVHEEDAAAGRLSFQTMRVEAEVSRQVYGANIQPSTTSAKGKVVFFNEYSTKSQIVKKGTTVTSKEGKKYTTQAAVTVPGYTLKNGKKVAGTSATTAITAAGVGPSYNTSGTTFTVSGWSGANAKLFYGQSAGAIAGGEDGVAHIVSEADKPDVIATLQAQLIERLKRETRAQIPDDLITFPDMQFASVDSDSVKLRGESIKFPASMKGSMVTYLISRDLLEQAIAREVSRDHTYPSVNIPTLGDLVVTPVNAIPTDSAAAPESIKVKVSGSGTIITKVPIETLRESLVGRPKRVFTNVAASVPEIDTAQYHFYPFWAPFFPSKESRITVETK